MDARAISKFVLISPRKARLTANLIKGKPVNEALAILSFTPKKAAQILTKVLKSAVSNAMVKEGSGKLDPDSLFVKEATIDPAPMMHRWKATAFGRAAHRRRRMSHIRIVVATKESQGSKAKSPSKKVKPKAVAQHKPKKKE